MEDQQLASRRQQLAHAAFKDTHYCMELIYASGEHGLWLCVIAIETSR